MHKVFRWNPEKNKKLKPERDISFEEIVFCIENSALVDIIDHPNQQKYNGQKMYLVNVNEYVHVIPFVESDDEIFLKTIYPSREYTKIYLKEVIL
ncbi:MAG TPA: toxin [Desulfobacteraceae bacterium]|jgi:uncharacterized DUF497 family protein|nr:toxin [Desulfobacteraceae bacterium]